MTSVFQRKPRANLMDLMRREDVRFRSVPLDIARKHDDSIREISRDAAAGVV